MKLITIGISEDSDKYFSTVRVVILSALLIMALFFIPFQAIGNSNGVGQVDPHFVQSIRDRGSNLYQELLILKKDPDFLFRGFGGKKGREWDAKSRTLRDDCSAELSKIPVPYRLQSELFDICVATARLEQIGLQYAMHEGADDKFSI